MAVQCAANRLAHHLIALRVTPDQPVAICVARSVGLLPILKAGAAYLPLDPAHPDARLHQVLADAPLPLADTAGRSALGQRGAGGKSPVFSTAVAAYRFHPIARPYRPPALAANEVLFGALWQASCRPPTSSPNSTPPRARQTGSTTSPTSDAHELDRGLSRRHDRRWQGPKPLCGSVPDTGVGRLR